MTRKLSVQLLGVGLAIAGIAVALVLVARSGSSDEAATEQPGPIVLADSYDEGEIVEPDPDFREGLALARFSTAGWKTDFSRHTVPFDEIIGGGPDRDGIPPLDFPRFTTTQDAGRWLGDEEPVIALELNGDARAYPSSDTPLA